MRVNKKVAGIVSGSLLFVGSAVTNVVLGIKLSKEKKKAEDALEELEYVSSRLDEELDIDNHYCIDDDTLEYLVNTKLIQKVEDKDHEDEEGEDEKDTEEKPDENSK